MYDVIIVGAGPAGIFSALELTKLSSLKVLLLERGKDLPERTCPMQGGYQNCARCSICATLCGWGGAGAFSDGKLTLSSRIGGFLNEYLPPGQLTELLHLVDSEFLKFGAPKKTYGNNPEDIRIIGEKALRAGLKFIPGVIRHLGTDRCREILKRIKGHLSDHVDIDLETEVVDWIVGDGQTGGVVTAQGEKIPSTYVILAPGRQGAGWLRGCALKHKLQLFNNPIDIGVRVEVPASIMDDLTEKIYEGKFMYYSKVFDDPIRTFCMNPHGEVVTEQIDGIITVNGHSYKDHRTDNTNFALLVSTDFTKPFNDPISYGRYLAQLANLLGDGVIVQRLGDLRNGRRSNESRIRKGIVEPTLKGATPGDLSFVLPYRYLQNIIEMLEALDRILPGIDSHHTLLYGVEVKFYSQRIKLTKTFESETRNLFMIGDGAGITRGLVQAASSGIVVARELAHRDNV